MTTDKTKHETLQDIGKNAMECIREMVAALECDYERLEELRDERDGYENDEGKPTWIADNPDEAQELADLEAAASANSNECTSRDVLRIRLDSGMSAGETYDTNAKNVDPLTASETLDELIARRQAEPEQTARERKRIHRLRQARLLDARGVKVWRGRKLPLPRSASAQ